MMKRRASTPRTEEARQLLLPTGPVPLPHSGLPGVVIGCRRVRGRCCAFALSPEKDSTLRVLIPAEMRIEAAVYAVEDLDRREHPRPHYRPVGPLRRLR